MSFSYVQTLIDKAAANVGSRNKLAQALDVNYSVLWEWETGKRTCVAADRARLAGFAGEDAVQELVRATLENAKGERRREQLEKVLGKLSRATGAALGFVALALGNLIFFPSSEAMAASYDVYYVEFIAQTDPAAFVTDRLQ